MIKERRFSYVAHLHASGYSNWVIASPIGASYPLFGRYGGFTVNFQMASFFKSLWGNVPKQSAGAAAVPANTRLYVIGDIHGRSDLLTQMHELIWEDMQHYPI